MFSPQDFGIRWAPGESIGVALHICDSPDTCGPNCADYVWSFFIIPQFGCARIPNPFTPNADGKNDFVQFYFPGLIFEPAETYIFDIYSQVIKIISVPAGSEAKIFARWDGTDSKGRPVPQGVYLYVITVGGEVVCEGTITIAR